MIRRAIVLAAVGLGAVLSASGAAAKEWPSLEFRPAVARPGDVVTVRVSLTPAHYVALPRPGGPRIEIVLVPERLARTVNSPRQDGVVRVGTIQADLSWRGSTAFRVPEIAAGQYVGAYTISGSFHAPMTGAPLGLEGFRLRVSAAPERERSGLGIVAVACAAGFGLLLARRRLARVVLPAPR